MDRGAVVAKVGRERKSFQDAGSVGKYSGRLNTGAGARRIVVYCDKPNPIQATLRETGRFEPPELA
jgi:hypothetical protein